VKLVLDAETEKAKDLDIEKRVKEQAKAAVTALDGKEVGGRNSRKRN